MKYIFIKALVLFSLLQMPVTAWSVNYTYTSLLFLDYDQFRPIVRNSLAESRKYKFPEQKKKALGPLKKTLKMLLSRPDNDDLIRKLAPDLISELKSMNYYSKITRQLFGEGIVVVESDKYSAKKRTTALIMLNNLLLQLKPFILFDVELAKQVCNIADSSLSVPKAVLQDAKTNTMRNEVSPTKLAKKIMEWYARKKQKNIQANSKGCPFSKRA